MIMKNALKISGLLRACRSSFATNNARPEALTKQTWVWGTGLNGQLGLGQGVTITKPQKLDSQEFTQFISLAAGQGTSAGINSRGQLYTWGNNQQKHLGNSLSKLHKPTKVTVQQKLLPKVSLVTSGYSYVTATTDGGDTYIWGSTAVRFWFIPSFLARIFSRQRQRRLIINTPETGPIKQTSCADGSIFLLNKSGKLFIYNTVTKVTSKQPIDFKEPSDPNKKVNIKKVQSGRKHSLALTEDGKVFAWGDNTYGQLGNGTNNSTSTPVLVTKLPSNVSDINCGQYFSAARINGDVYTWGNGQKGQLGNKKINNENNPVKVDINEPIKQVNCGMAHTSFITQSGKLLMVGKGKEGQLGRQVPDYSLEKLQVVFPYKVNILQVSCGDTHTLVNLEKL